MHHKGVDDYLGARLGEDKRLVLVPLDPDRPWVAFRRMRAWMKREQPRPPAVAEIIPFRPKDPAR
jgi:hypothetical protein